MEEPQRNWWSELKLGSPEALIKVFVNQSGCFTLVDRGAGLNAAQLRFFAMKLDAASVAFVGVPELWIQATDLQVRVKDKPEANSTITNTSFGSSVLRRIRWPFASARAPGVS